MSYLARRDVVHVRNIRHVRVARERTLIDDLLFADPAPARLLGGIIGIRCPGVQEIARPHLVAVCLIVREGIPIRVRHRIEVIQVTEELLEAMEGRQILAEIAEVVFAELPGGIALHLES
jgi:hypothetical protein